MSFSKIPANIEIKELFKRLVKEENLSQALLLSGDLLSFKDELAFELAKALHCEKGEGDACDECRSCKLMEGVEDENGNLIPSHPDFLYIVPENNNIKIDVIREIATFVRSRPMLSKKKVILIKDADRMNVEAQNAFLKILEEPHFFVHYILTSSRIDTILDTIISRVQKIYLKRVGKDEFIKFFSTYPDKILEYAFERGISPSEVSEEDVKNSDDLSFLLRGIVYENRVENLIKIRDIYGSSGKEEKVKLLKEIIFYLKKILKEFYASKIRSNNRFDEEEFKLFFKLEAIEGDLMLNINRDLSFAALLNLILNLKKFL